MSSSTRKTDNKGVYWDHDPNAKKDYSVDWNEWLDEVSDTITSTLWLVTPSTINIESTSVSAGFATVFVSGGVDGETYHLTSRIFTATRRDDRTLRLKVAPQ